VFLRNLFFNVGTPEQHVPTPVQYWTTTTCYQSSTPPLRVNNHISTATPYVSNTGGVSTKSTTATATLYVPLFLEY
jgi:hypothetical protein